MKSEQLKALRKKHGVSQMLLSKQAEVSRYNISLCEVGIRELNQTEIKKIKTYFKGTKNAKD